MTAKRRDWTDEELNFLIFAYQSEYYTTAEIAQALNRPIRSVWAKASGLNLKRPVKKDDLPDGYKRCSQCSIIMPLDHFTKDSGKKGGLRSYCKFCGAKYQENRRLKKTQTLTSTAPTSTAPTSTTPTQEHKTKKCKGCYEVKQLDEFGKNKRMKDGHLNYCKICEGKRKRKWYINGGYKYD